MRISDWSSDVCSSDLGGDAGDDHQEQDDADQERLELLHDRIPRSGRVSGRPVRRRCSTASPASPAVRRPAGRSQPSVQGRAASWRSEEHTSELQSLMRLSYAVFFLKKNNTHYHNLCYLLVLDPTSS